MRVVSLLPSTTEILFALGAGDDVVGVTFECDHPAEARRRRVVSTSAMPEGLSPREIDNFVKASLERGDDLYHLQADALAELDPDLVVTQDLCAVCAIDVTAVDEAMAYLGCRADVLTFDPHTIDEVLDSVISVGMPWDGGTKQTRWWGRCPTGWAPLPRRWRGPSGPVCSCSSRPTLPSRRATGSRRWSRPLGGSRSSGADRRSSGSKPSWATSQLRRHDHLSQHPAAAPVVH